jgi:hypothetical protein
MVAAIQRSFTQAIDAISSRAGFHIEIKIGAGKPSKLGAVTIKDARPKAA